MEVIIRGTEKRKRELSPKFTLLTILLSPYCLNVYSKKKKFKEGSE